MKSVTELNQGTPAQVSLRGDSLHITPPSGRSYYIPVGEWISAVCPDCDGEGRHDSCFECGNRGFMLPTKETT